MSKNAASMRTSSKSLKTRIFYYRWFYVMALPVIVFVLLFNYLPMLGVRFAFYDYKPIGTPTFVGMKHFETLFAKPAFWTAFKNTLQISITKLLLTAFLAVFVSLLLNEMRNIHAKKTFQTIIYLPHFLSWVVAASVFTLILSPSNEGLVNAILKQFGIIEKGEEIYFLANTKFWRPMFYVIDVWKDTGWSTILYLATLAGISPDLYEAAEMDGANRWQQLKFITLPALYNTIITVLILNLAKILNLFEPVFVLYNEAVYEVSDVIQTYIYRQTFGVGVPNYGYTTAVGLFKSLVACILVLACNQASKKVRGRGIV